MTSPDVKTLIGEVAARHGITLRSDDPAFALVTVNQLVLEQTMLDLIQRTQEMTAEFDRAGDRLQERAGRVLAGELRKAGTEIRLALRQDIAAAMRSRQSAARPQQVLSRSMVYCWLSLGMIGGLALLIIGIVIGRWWQ
jgi:Transcriptional activator TraM